MEPPRRGVITTVSCNGTPDQGSLFHFQIHSNYSVVVVIWIFVPHVIYIYHVIGATCWKAWDTHFVLKTRFFFFSFFRFSFCHTSHLSPFPFSATTQVINKHTKCRQNLTGQLYLICKRCWIHLRHVRTLHEPCRGCAIMDSLDWDFWTPGRGRSAWWRHPCWMFHVFSFFH